MLREEIRELREAVVDGDRVEILDALCDIKYVNDGTANMMGVDQNDLLFDLYDIETRESTDTLLDHLKMDVKDVRYINWIVIKLANRFKFPLQNFKTALDRVHESNMSKFCNDIKTAERTQEFYQKQGVNTTVKPREKKFVVYREGDGKVLKSCEFLPPYLEDLV